MHDPGYFHYEEKEYKRREKKREKRKRKRNPYPRNLYSYRKFSSEYFRSFVAILYLGIAATIRNIIRSAITVKICERHGRELREIVYV